MTQSNPATSKALKYLLKEPPMPRTQEVSPPHAAATEAIAQLRKDALFFIPSPEAQARLAQIISQHYAPLFAKAEWALNLAKRNAESRLYMLPVDGPGVSEQKDILSSEIGTYADALAAIRGEL